LGPKLKKMLALSKAAILLLDGIKDWFNGLLKVQNNKKGGEY
jgi:hypothetical protein